VLQGEKEKPELFEIIKPVHLKRIVKTNISASSPWPLFDNFATSREKCRQCFTSMKQDDAQ
jgi:hypothetical protein